MMIRSLFATVSLFVLFTFSFESWLFASPNFLTLQSRITQPDGQYLEVPSVNYRISITDPVGTCVVYQEDFSNVSMVGSKGLVSIKIGSGVRGYPVAATTMKDVFTNLSSPVFNCQAGGTYTAASSDQRKLVLQFNDGGGWQTVPGLEINSTPFAIESFSSQKLGAFPAADYVRLAQLATCVGGEAVHFNGTNFTCVPVGGGSASAVAAAAGLVGTPSISFSGDTNTGFYSGAADTISISNNGSNTFNITTTAITSTTTGGANVTQTNGTAGAPTFSFAGDADTGWYRPAADTLATSTAGAERMRIDSLGNVGVGTTSPGGSLDIVGPAVSTATPGYVLRAVGGANAGGSGSAILLQGGTGAIWNLGGSVQMLGGINSNLAGVTGGSVTVTGAEYSGIAGDTNITGGVGQNGQPGGNVSLQPGLGVAGGGYGKIILAGAGGNVGVGTTNPVAPLEISSSETSNAASTKYGIKTNMTYTPTLTNTNSVIAGEFDVNYSGGFGIDTTGNIVGISGAVHLPSFGAPANIVGGTFTADGNVTGFGTTNLYGVTAGSATTGGSRPSMHGGAFDVFTHNGTATNVYGVKSTIARSGAAGTISNSYGLYTETTRSAGAITNGYGVYTGNIQSTNKWSFYAADATAPSYFAGNVGIGTATPSEELAVEKSQTSETSVAVRNQSASASATALVITASDTSTLLMGSASSVFSIPNLAGRSMVQGIGGLSVGAITDTIRFTTGLGYTERMRIDASGNVGIGTTAPDAKLDIADTSTTTSAIIVPRAGNFTGATVNGMVRYNTTSTLFEFYQNGSWVNYTAVSDGRLKTNIVPVNEGLKIVNQLNPVFYDWDRTNSKSSGFEDKHQVGFIAQEVEKVLPEVVNKGEDSYRSLEYGKIVSVVVAAIKELYAKVVDQNDEILTQNRKIASLKANLSATTTRFETENNKLKLENAAIKTYLCAKDPKSGFCK